MTKKKVVKVVEKAKIGAQAFLQHYNNWVSGFFGLDYTKGGIEFHPNWRLLFLESAYNLADGKEDILEELVNNELDLVYYDFSSGIDTADNLAKVASFLWLSLRLRKDAWTFDQNKNRQELAVQVNLAASDFRILEQITADEKDLYELVSFGVRNINKLDSALARSTVSPEALTQE